MQKLSAERLRLRSCCLFIIKLNNVGNNECRSRTFPLKWIGELFSLCRWLLYRYGLIQLMLHGANGPCLYLPHAVFYDKHMKSKTQQHHSSVCAGFLVEIRLMRSTSLTTERDDYSGSHIAFPQSSNVRLPVQHKHGPLSAPRPDKTSLWERVWVFPCTGLLLRAV